MEEVEVRVRVRASRGMLDAVMGGVALGITSIGIGGMLALWAGGVGVPALVGLVAGPVLVGLFAIAHRGAPPPRYRVVNEYPRGNSLDSASTAIVKRK